MRIRLLVYALAISPGLVLLSSACNPTSPRVELKVASAGSLAEVFQTLAERFEEENAVHVIPSFAATGQLTQQIRNGAPYDIFAAADSSHVDALIGEGYLDADTRTVYAQGELVIIRPVGSTLNIDSLSRLASNDLDRIAIANPDHAPYGIAAKEALRAAGIWPEVESKIIYGETVKQAAVIVATGNADAGIIARSVVDPEVQVVFEIPPERHSSILHVAARVSSTANKEVALAFLEFMLSTDGQAILQSFGFSHP